MKKPSILQNIGLDMNFKTKFVAKELGFRGETMVYYKITLADVTIYETCFTSSGSEELDKNRAENQFAELLREKLT